MPASSAAPLAITVASAGDAVTLRVSGEIDIEGCPLFAEALESAARSHAHVHVDLAEVGYMDSSGLHVLIVARRAAQANGRTVDVTAASTIVVRLFDLTGLSDLLTAPGA